MEIRTIEQNMTIQFCEHAIYIIYMYIQVPELVSVGSQAVRLFHLTALSPFLDGHFPVVWLLVLSPSQHTISASTEM